MPDSHSSKRDELGWAIDYELGQPYVPVSRRELAEMLRDILFEHPFDSDSVRQAYSVSVRFAEMEIERERR